MKVRLSRVATPIRDADGAEKVSRSRSRMVDVGSVPEAIKTCRTYVARHKLTSDTWTGGKLIDESGSLLGRIDVNGQVLPPGEAVLTPDPERLDCTFRTKQLCELEDELQAVITRTSSSPRLAIDDWSIGEFEEYPKLSRETIAYTAVLHYKGVPVLTATNEGSGGITVVRRLRIDERAFETKFANALAEWLRSIGLPGDGDGYDLWMEWETRGGSFDLTAQEYFAETEVLFTEIRLVANHPSVEASAHRRLYLLRDVLSGMLNRILETGVNWDRDTLLVLDELRFHGFEITAKPTRRR